MDFVAIRKKYMYPSTYLLIDDTVKEMEYIQKECTSILENTDEEITVIDLKEYRQNFNIENKYEGRFRYLHIKPSNSIRLYQEFCRARASRKNNFKWLYIIGAEDEDTLYTLCELKKQSRLAGVIMTIAISTLNFDKFIINGSKFRGEAPNLYYLLLYRENINAVTTALFDGKRLSEAYNDKYGIYLE